MLSRLSNPNSKPSCNFQDFFGSTCPDCCGPAYCLAATCSWEKDHIMLCSLCSSARDVLFFSLCFTSALQLSHGQRCLKFLRYTSLQPKASWSMSLPHARVRLAGFQPFNSSVLLSHGHRSPNLVCCVPRQHEGCCKVWVP